MKKQAIAALLALLLTVPLMSGCGKQSEPPDSAVESTAAETTTADSAQEEDTFTYDGTFNEEVFQHIIQNIELFGHKVSMPCTLADLGEDFSLDDEPSIDEAHSIVTYSLFCKDEEIGSIQYPSDHALTEEETRTLAFTALYIAPMDSASDYSDTFVAGLTIHDTYQHIKNVLGVPTSSAKYEEDKKGYVNYWLTDEEGTTKEISFYVRDDSIEQISVFILNQE